MSVAALAREGRATELPGIGKTLEEKIQSAGGDRVHPGGGEAAREVPRRAPRRSRACPAWAPSARACSSTSWASTRSTALRAAAEGERLRGVKGFGPKAETNILEGLAAAEAGDVAEAAVRALTRRSRSAEPLLAALRDNPAADRVELAGLGAALADSVKDLDIIATAHDPEALANAAALAASTVAAASGVGAAGARLTHAHRAGGRPARRRARAVRQPPPALHGLQAAQRGAARGRGAPGPARLRVRGPRRRRRRDPQAARPRRRSTSCSASPTSSPSCARTAASWRPRPTATCRSSSSWRTSRATCTATPSPPTAATRSRRWRGRRSSAGSSTSPSPTTRPRRASATDVSPTQLRRQIERVRELNEEIDGIELLIGSEVNILPDGSLDYEDDLLGAARLGHRFGAHVVPHARGGADAADRRRLRAPVGRLHRPPHRSQDRAPAALRARRRAVIEAAARTGTMLEINAAPTAATSTTSTPAPPRRPACRSSSTRDAHKPTRLRLPPLGRGHRPPRLARPSSDIANTRRGSEFAPLRKRAKASSTSGRRSSVQRRSSTRRNGSGPSSRP